MVQPVNTTNKDITQVWVKDQHKGMQIVIYKASHKVNGPSLEPRHIQSKESCIEETPACVGQVDEILRAVRMNADVVKNASKEIPARCVRNCDEELESTHDIKPLPLHWVTSPRNDPIKILLLIPEVLNNSSHPIFECSFSNSSVVSI